MRTALALAFLLLSTVVAVPVASAGPTCAQVIHVVCDVANPVVSGVVAAAGAAESYALCIVAVLLTTPIPGIPAAILAC